MTTKDIFAQTLADYPTKVLLQFLDLSRKCGGFYSPFDTRVGWTTAQLKEELSTREHIPNKQEAKSIRQQAAKNKKRKN